MTELCQSCAGVLCHSVLEKLAYHQSMYHSASASADHITVRNMELRLIIEQHRSDVTAAAGLAGSDARGGYPA